jgi:Ca2+-transporting ATPase
MSIARLAGLGADAGLMTGIELQQLGDAELGRRLAHTRIICRVQPEQKLRLVQAFQTAGATVAMTGDGVNDAPALKAADIGVAMGARGTDVAREASALVLLDDDFAALVNAVRQGRRIFANLRKAMVFVVAVHVPIVGLSLAPVLLGWPLLLMPIHVLFLQLVIDPACSLVFEAEPAEGNVMAVPPRPSGQRLFSAAVVTRGLWQGIGLFGVLLGLTAWSVSTGASAEAVRAATFIALVLADLGLIHANRSWGWRFFSGPTNRYFIAMVPVSLALLGAVIAIPALRRAFGFAIPGPELLWAAIAVAIVAMVWFELVKLAQRHPEGGRAMPAASSG